jgi:hypothetical protein
MTSAHRLRWATCALTLLCLLAGGSPAHAQADPWAPYRYFVGSWKGEGRGTFGDSAVTREIEWFGSGFIRLTTSSLHAPREGSKQGEQHREVAWLGIDLAGGRFTLRQFHSEGIYNQYAATGGGAGEYIFDSEVVEGLGPGRRARETWRIVGPDEFTEVFEVAEPGGDFQVYVTNTLRRVKPAAAE